MTINTDLAREKGLSLESVVLIENLHDLRDDIHQMIVLAQHYGNRSLTYSLAQSLFPIETELQKLWGFPEDIGFYRFWNVKGCRCTARMDNEDAYPHGRYTISEGCWLHWKEGMGETK